MTFGLQLWDASGNLVFDSTVAAGGAPIGMAEGNGVSVQTLSFPQYAGLTMQALTINGIQWSPEGFGVTISHASGFPVVTVESGAPTVLLGVF